MAYADTTPRNLKSALEAQVMIILPSDEGGLELVELLRREGKHDNHLEASSLNQITANSKLFEDPLHCFRRDVNGKGQRDIKFSGVGV